MVQVPSHPMDQFEGRTAVVTGAASGIGLSIVEAFAAEGMRVVMADVDEENLRRRRRGWPTRAPRSIPFAATCGTPRRSNGWAPRRLNASGGSMSR